MPCLRPSHSPLAAPVIRLGSPPMKPTTWLLWVGPFALMLAAIIGFALYVRRRAREDDDETNNEEFA